LGFKIIVRGPDKRIRELVLAEGDNPIGRDPANSLVLDGRGVSRRHAKLVLQGENLSLVDLGSTYGTRVNNAVMIQRQLLDGDAVTIGMHHLIVKHEDLPSPAHATAPKSINSEEPYIGDDLTQAPPQDIHQRKTLQMNRNALNFILDNPDDEGRAVKVLPNEDSSLVKAVERLGAATDFKEAGYQTLPGGVGETADPDYQALLLMYKVSELLAGSADLDSFVEQMADLVLEEVQADTVVLLLRDGDNLEPRVIRHRGSLKIGEVPISRNIIDRVVEDRIAVMSNDVSHDARIAPGQSVALYNIRAVLAFPLLLHGELTGILYLSRSLAKPFTTADGDLVAALASLVVSGLETARLTEQMLQEKQQRKALERFHPPEVVDQLFKSGVGESSLEELQATVLVCGLGGFDALVGKVEPIKLASVLHEYYELLYEKIFANGGSLVRLNDSWALALFGISQSANRDAVWAVESARMLCHEFSSLAALWPSRLVLHCALDTGPVVAGIVGSLERPEYTAIGTPISTASAMIQHAAGETSILVTERTWGNLPKQRFQVEAAPAVGDVAVYSLKV
jgi:adenylate cyclase